jgi:hypothetical protein
MIVSFTDELKNSNAKANPKSAISAVKQVWKCLEFDKVLMVFIFIWIKA